MKVYTYNANGLLTGEESINGDIIPIGATAIAPPEIPQGCYAIFDGARWLSPTIKTWIDTAIRPQRNRLLDAADQRVRRYDYQLRAGVATTDSVESIAAVLNYMQELRDLPETAQPESFAWPEVP